MNTNNSLEWMLFAGTVVFALMMIGTAYLLPNNTVLQATIGTILGNFSGGLLLMLKQQWFPGTPPVPPVQGPVNPPQPPVPTPPVK